MYFFIISAGASRLYIREAWSIVRMRRVDGMRKPCVEFDGLPRVAIAITYRRIAILVGKVNKK